MDVSGAFSSVLLVNRKFSKGCICIVSFVLRSSLMGLPRFGCFSTVSNRLSNLVMFSCNCFGTQHNKRKTQNREEGGGRVCVVTCFISCDNRMFSCSKCSILVCFLFSSSLMCCAQYVSVGAGCGWKRDTQLFWRCKALYSSFAYVHYSFACHVYSSWLYRLVYGNPTMKKSILWYTRHNPLRDGPMIVFTEYESGRERAECRVAGGKRGRGRKRGGTTQHLTRQ